MKKVMSLLFTDKGMIMPGSATLYYWERLPSPDDFRLDKLDEKDKGHVSIGKMDENGRDVFHAAYVTGDHKPPRCCKRPSKAYEERLKFTILDTFNEDKLQAANGRKVTDKVVILGVNIARMQKVLKKFKKEHEKRKKIQTIGSAAYMRINCNLFFRRLVCMNWTDRFHKDFEINYILDTGHANCSVFAYFLLRAGGLEPPDGVPKRHLLLSFVIGICGFIEFLAEMENINTAYPKWDDASVTQYPNVTDDDRLFFVRTGLFFFVPVITLLGASIIAIRNCCLGFPDLRTPKSVYHFAKWRSKNPLLSEGRRFFGPHNVATRWLYGLLVFFAVVDIPLAFLGYYTEPAIKNSIYLDSIEAAMFFTAVILDYLFDSDKCKMYLRKDIVCCGKTIFTARKDIEQEVTRDLEMNLLGDSRSSEAPKT